MPRRLTFLVVFIFLLWSTRISVTCQRQGRLKGLRSNSQHQSGRITFRVLTSEKSEEGGIITSRHLYTATDGTRVSRAGEVYPSAVAAEERMEGELKRAVKIIERGVLFEKRRKVGERVVAEFAPASKELRRFAILSRRKEVFIRVESSSLEHVLAFERFEKHR